MLPPEEPVQPLTELVSTPGGISPITDGVSLLPEEPVQPLTETAPLPQGPGSTQSLSESIQLFTGS